MRKFLLPVLFFSSSVALSDSSMTVTKTAPVSPWSASYLNETYGPNLKIEERSYDSYHYFSLKRNLGEDGWSVSLVGIAESKFGEKTKNETIQGDHYIKIASPDVFKNDYITVSPQLRAYSAASENSKKNNQDFTYNPRVYVTSSAGDFDLTYIFLPYIYTYKKESDDQKVFKQGHYFATSYNVTPSFSIDMFVYPSWSYYRKGKAVTYNDVNIGPGISAKLTDKISLSGWIDTYAVNYKPERATMAASLSVTLF